MKTIAGKAVRRSATKQPHRSAMLPVNHNSADGQPCLSVFRTPLGWFGLVGQSDCLTGVYVGHTSASSVRAAAEQPSSVAQRGDWFPELRQRLEAYAEGEIVDFSEIPLRLPTLTGFRAKVVVATRRIAFGATATYGELARRAGHPRAARAVGTVMSSNRFPILIPCHRVLAAGGRIGGYTCPTGITMKQKLLELEARALGNTGNRSRLLPGWH